MTTTLYCPIASCAGVSNPDAAAYDKRWLVIDQHGQWLSSKECVALADISIELRFGCLILRAPGMLRLDIPLDVIEDDDSVCRDISIGKQGVTVVDEGDLVAAWMTRFLQQPCRLVKVHPDAGPVLWP